MDSKQIDAAMRDKLPVVYDGKRYDRIQEYVSWYDNTGHRRLSCGLVLGRHLVRVPAEKVEMGEEMRTQ